MGEITQPARAPIPALSTKDSVTMFLALIPHSCAASRLQAQARICRPSSVRAKKKLSAATITAEMPSTHKTWGEM
jgi:hypothetical protein